MLFRHAKSIFAVIFSSVCLLSSTQAQAKDLSIVATNFPQYDFVRHIVGDKVKVQMLLKLGAEAHSFEPTPKDLIAIQSSDLFVYNGGENDEWIEPLLENKEAKLNTFAFTKVVSLREEEEKDGMEEEHDHDHDHAKDDDHDHDEDDDEEEIEYDEHVWTSPLNDIRILKELSNKVIALDPENKAYYEANTNAYIKEFEDIDSNYKSIIKNAKRKTLIFGDRFPLLYFVKDYDLDYFAAFKGCSNETEVSAATVKFLIDKAKTTKAPVIFKIELTNDAIAKTIAEAVDAKVLTFNTGHNLTVEQFENNTSLADLFKLNYAVLKEALN